MQEKKNIGKTYEGTEEYVAFFVKGYYVLVQESSLCGLDYTIYDANFREIDGGVITDNETDDKLAFGCDMLAEIDSSIMFNDIVIVDYNMVTAIVDRKPEFTTKEKPIVAVDLMEHWLIASIRRWRIRIYYLFLILKNIEMITYGFLIPAVRGRNFLMPYIIWLMSTMFSLII